MLHALFIKDTMHGINNTKSESLLGLHKLYPPAKKTAIKLNWHFTASAPLSRSTCIYGRLFYKNISIPNINWETEQEAALYKFTFVTLWHTRNARYCMAPYKELSRKESNKLTPRGLFCSRRVHGTCVAQDTHQTSTYSTQAFQHLFQHGTKVCFPT